MRREMVLFSLIAIVILMLTIGIYLWLQSTEEKKAPVKMQIIVAAKHLTAGTKLDLSDLRWQAWSDKMMHPDYLANNVVDMKTFMGGVLLVDIDKNQPVTRQMIARVHGSRYLSLLIKPNMRAVSVSVSPANEVSGFILPGDSVDVLVSPKAAQEGNASKGEMPQVDVSQGGLLQSKMVLQNVRVLAVDQQANNSDHKQHIIAKTVTMEVTPGQAVKLASAQASGTLLLSLRSVIAENVDGLKSSEDTYYRILQYRGGKASEIQVPEEAR